MCAAFAIRAMRRRIAATGRRIELTLRFAAQAPARVRGGPKGAGRRARFRARAIHGIIQLTTYCCRTTITPSSSVSTMLCLNVRARTEPSCPCS